MCYAILRVSYKGEKSRENIEVERQADLSSKLEEIKGRSQVIAVSVYRCERRVTLTQTWTDEPYIEPKQEPING